MQAQDKWNTEVLSKIEVKTTNATELEMFYTALYHGHLLPADRTGENPYWESQEPYYDDFYTLWDTFRCLHSLHTLIVPERQEGVIRAMIDIWRHERFMPEGRSHNHNGRVQGGSNSDNVLADSYVKGLRGGINWKDGYAAMKTNAEVVPYNNFDFEDPTGSTKEGRGALEDWLMHGYVTPKFGRSLSKTVEYALNDFSLSQVARGEAPEDVALYLNRSRQVSNTKMMLRVQVLMYLAAVAGKRCGTPTLPPSTSPASLPPSTQTVVSKHMIHFLVVSVIGWL
jgi:putative alpha-1,2-mannosidase